MQGQEFRKWAEYSYRYYGGSPWFFLRELAQNSRDAGAQTIWVSAEGTPDGKEILTFSDNGRGMSFEHARRYLFRLYSSSKINEKYSAGMYGSGFWTILRFSPKNITIESATKKELWGISIDPDFKVKRIPPLIQGPGTRITLTRKSEFKNHMEFRQEIEKALLHYCSYLRRNDRKFSQLPVIYQGKNITLSMKLSGPVTLNFRKGPVEGAVGLGREPKVSLYARGLPVWEGTTLEELSHTLPSHIKDCEIGWGLAPVFLLNGNNLDVTMSRKATIDNRAFKKVHKAAQQSLSKLIQISADMAVPRKWYNRILDVCRRYSSHIIRSPLKLIVLLLIIILPLELLILNIYYPFKKSGSDSESIYHVVKNKYHGASVIHFSREKTVDMSYYPPLSTWFKIFTADQYDIKSGFIRDPNNNSLSSVFSISSRDNIVSVQLKISNGGSIFLPQPAGYNIDPESVIFNKHTQLTPKLSGGNEVVIHLGGKGGLIQYQCFPSNPKKALSQTEVIRLTRIPDELEFPPSSELLFREFSMLRTEERVNKALVLTGSLLKYDNSDQTEAQYIRSADQPEWFPRVLQITKGDCDVINGVAALFLRRMDIPSRLVIGLVGEKGKILPGLHAWIEYFNQGWKTVDASQFTPRLYENELPPLIDKTTPNPAGHAEKRRNYLPYFYLGIFLSLSIIILVCAMKKKHRLILKIQDSNSIKENLAKIAIRAMLQPEAWGGHDSNIWYSRIIPTLNGKSISIKQAMKLQKEGKLFIGKYKHTLSAQSIKAGIPVLNIGNRAFAPLIRMIPGHIDLDMIASLKAISPEKMEGNSIASILIRVNRILRKIGKISTRCMWAPGLTKQDFLDVNLPRISRKQSPSWPGQFIAVNPNSPRILAIANLFQKNSHLAVFKTIKNILQESGHFPESKEITQKKASLALLKEMR